MEAKKMYIDGEWVIGSMAKTFDVINPATGEVIDKVYESSVEDTRLAIAAAKRSFYETREWRDMDSQTRGDIILKIADLIEKYADELAMMDTLDNGKPLREAEGDISDGIHCFRYYAGLCKTPHGGVYEVNDGFGKMHSYETRAGRCLCADHSVELSVPDVGMEARTSTCSRQQYCF